MDATTAAVTIVAVPVVSTVFFLIVMRPQYGAYLYLIASPLIVGIARGDTIGVLRPNEMLMVLLLGALAVRSLLSMRAREHHKAGVGRVDLALVLLAFTSSVLPLLLQVLRDLPVSTDDLLYSIVFWKYLVVYRAFRAFVSTASQVERCLWMSMTSAALAGIVGILQVGNLFGIPEFLHSHYDQPFEGTTTALTERATSTLASAHGLGDISIMNLMIAMALLRGKQSRRGIFMAALGVFLSAIMATGEFSELIGLGVALLAFAAISGRPSRVLAIGIPAAIGALAVFWPVYAIRMVAVDNVTGLPGTWMGRWNNLQTYFFPRLFSGFNWLVGVQLAPRLPALETWRQFVYIESGYVWLLWIGGMPLLAAFIFFAWVSGQHLRQIARERSDAVGVAAKAGFGFLFVLLTLMLFDPHVTLRGSADLFYPLLALSFVRVRSSRVLRPEIAGAGLTFGRTGSGSVSRPVAMPPRANP
jgi:hypothetical protein